MTDTNKDTKKKTCSCSTQGSPTDGGCGGNCSCSNKGDSHTQDQGTCCGHKDSSKNEGSCGCAHTDEAPLELSAAQIKRVNEILGDIDDDDLESGDYDLTDEQALELNQILFGKQAS